MARNLMNFDDYLDEDWTDDDKDNVQKVRRKNFRKFNQEGGYSNKDNVRKKIRKKRQEKKKMQDKANAEILDQE
jgi:hypothetical protein